jgi:hypothetical protein
MKVYDWSKESTYIYDWSNASTVYGQMEVYDLSNQSQWMFMINEKKAYDWSNWSIWQVKGKDSTRLLKWKDTSGRLKVSLEQRISRLSWMEMWPVVVTDGQQKVGSYESLANGQS